MNGCTRTTSWCLGLAQLLVAWPACHAEATPSPGTVPTLSQPYVYDTWLRREGLPQDSVTALVQDAYGFLWVGSQEGLARFDGREFEVFDRLTTPQIASNWIYDLAVDSGGSVWIATRRGLARFQHGEFQLYTSADGLPHPSVRVLLQDRTGRLWIGTAAGLSLFDAGRGRFHDVGDRRGMLRDTILALHEDRQGVLWIGTEEGLSRFEPAGSPSAGSPPAGSPAAGSPSAGSPAAGSPAAGSPVGRWRTYTTAEGLSHNAVFALLEDRRGTLWIGTSAGLDRLVDGRLEAGVYEELASLPVQALHEDVDGTVWIGSGGGLFRVRDGMLIRDAHLGDEDVRAFLEDHEGSLWIGLWTGGLARARKTDFDHFGAVEGLPHDVAWTIYQDRAGAMWIGSNDGLTRLLGDEVRSFPFSGRGRAAVTTVLEDRAGNLWAGTWERGLVRLHDGALDTDPATGGFPLRITCLLEDRGGRLWIGTEGRGLHRRDGDGRTHGYTVGDGLPSNVVRDLYEDRAGALWIATEGGLARFLDGRFETFHPRDASQGSAIYTIHGGDAPGGGVAGRGETLWLGTWGDGLLRFRDGAFVHVTAKDGLPAAHVYRILEDDLGRLWMSGPRQIFRIDKKELDDFADGLRASFTSVSFDRSSGLRSEELKGGSQPAGWKSADGRLWFPTVKGAVIVDPANVEVHRPAPPVQVTGLLVDRRPVAPYGQPALPAGSKEFELHYKVLDFSRSRNVRTRHMLVGFNQDWVEGDGRHRAYYTNLDPGRYVFRVGVADSGGAWSGKEGSFTFVLRPAFHQTWYFYVACALTAVLLTWGGHRFLVRRLVVYNQSLRRVQRELEARNRELARFIYTLSHDIKNPLLTIRTFVGAVDEEASQAGSTRMRSDLRRIHDAAETLQQILDELLEVSRIGRVVQPPAELALGELAAEAIERLSDQLRERRIEVALRGEFPVVLGDRRRLVEVFEHLVENAVKFLGDEAAPKIEVGARDDGDEKVCYVRDNGIGIDPRYHERVFNLFDQLDPGTEGIGAGLASVRHIVELHHGRIWVESEGRGAGTTLAFTLPGLGG